jgi:hypothetical protein
MKVFEKPEGGGTFRFGHSSGEPFGAKKLSRFRLGAFASAVVETEVMDPVDVENGKVVVRGWYRSEASFTRWMA